MIGRPRKPTHLKLITGNPGRRPLPKGEPKPKLAIPAVPTELCDDAKLEWGRVSQELLKMGLLSELDRGVLAAYCQAYGRWIRAERILREMAIKDPATGAMVIKTSNGNFIQNPLIGIANKAQSDMVRFAAEFGMSPSARSRVRGDGEDNDTKTDPAAQYLA